MRLGYLCESGARACRDHRRRPEPVPTADCEQEYSYDDQPDIMWRDWTVELRSGEVYLLAHWRVQANEAPAIWSWASNEAETAFIAACTLIGQRVRKTLVVESSGPTSPVPPRSRHH